MELNQSDHQCLDHLSNQDPSSIAQFVQEARSKESWLFQTSSIKDYGGQMLLWTFNPEDFFCSLPQICLNTILSLSSAGHSFDLMA